MKRRVKTHAASIQDSSTPVPWRWRSHAARIRGCNEPGPFPEGYLDKGTPGSLLMAFPGTGNKGVARNLRPASLEVLPKPRFLPGFQRFREVFAELLGQRIEVISLPSSARRAGRPCQGRCPV